MEDLGLLCMGIFVGSITTLVIKYLNSASDWKIAVAVILPAAFAGVSVTFIKQLASSSRSSSISCYPIGLVLGLVWNYMDEAKKLVHSGVAVDPLLGYMQIFFTGLVTLLALVIAGREPLDFLISRLKKSAPIAATPAPPH